MTLRRVHVKYRQLRGGSYSKQGDYHLSCLLSAFPEEGEEVENSRKSTLTPFNRLIKSGLLAKESMLVSNIRNISI